MNLTVSLLLPITLGASPATVPGLVPPPGMHGAMMPSVPSPMGPTAPCPPLGPPAPLLAVRVIAPEGTRVAPIPGVPNPRFFKTDATFGFRPGYLYPLQLSNIPCLPDVSLYPTLEVRGSLVPRPGMKYMEFPAPVTLNQTDIDRVLSGGIVEKVIYLEDPTRAIPAAAKPDEPIELTDFRFDQAMKDASDNGRIVAILRLGNRVPDAEDLARMTVANTVLLPGDEALATPPTPPYLNWCGVPLYDPILGPKSPSEECLTDGGDTATRLGIGPYQRLAGLDTTDVAAEFTVAGKRRVTTSNVVCICSPRFVVRRVELHAGGLSSRAGLDSFGQLQGRHVASMNTPTFSVANREKPVETGSRMRASMTIVINGIAEVMSISAPQIVAVRSGLAIVANVVEPEEITSFPNDLVVTKSVDPKGTVAQGTEVTITLKYRNGFPEPVSDIVLSDSLSGRLEYIPGSAQSDRPVNVTTRTNEAGSVVVRFEIPGPIPAGQTGLVTFKARVR